MYTIKKKLIESITYPKDVDPANKLQFGADNKLYRSLYDLFQAFWIYNKKELYLVGGCVRDMLLGREPKDYDLCTNATPEEVKEIIRSLRLESFDSGIKHGTLTVIDKFYGQSYEITTYRVDGKYSDGRHPDEVTFTPSLEEDLRRRDFTINSFAYDMLKEEVLMVYPFYLTDLNLGVIRTVGNPVDRFNEDALRMLRAIRFAAQLSFSISPDTFKAIKECAHLIQYVSHERIRDELTKILLSDNPQMLEFIVETRLEDYYMWDGHDYIGAMVECEHQNPWHYTDVFHHTMDVIKKLPKQFELRWAALFHDIGKPYVKALKPGTTDHYRYIGHPEESAKIADKMMDILKFSNDQKEVIHKFVLYHDYPLSTCSMKKFKQKLVEIGEENFLNFIKLREADALAHKLSKSTSFAIEAIQVVKDRYDMVIRCNSPLRIKDLEVDGYDLSDLGMKGPEIGQTLQLLLEKVLENPAFNERELLLKYVEEKLVK